MSRKERRPPLGSAEFGRELRRRRRARELTVRDLGQLVGYDPSHVSRVENGAKRATREFASLCDHALDAAGELLGLWSVAPSRPRVAQLPAALPSFVGRAAQLRHLDEVMWDTTMPGVSRVVVVDGPAGAGKTAVVLTWAHRAALRFPDGQLYVDLRGFAPDDHEHLDASTILEGFLTALGIDAIPFELDRRAALYRSLLAGQRILVVLDNVADASQVEPLLPGSADCAVAITSRARLSELSVRLNPARVTVGPLEFGDAIRLLTAVIGTKRVAAESEILQELVGICGGLPLALRLAAERIATHPDQPVSAVIAELRAADEPGVSVVTDEVVALRAVFSWSYRALDKQEASLFRLLGLQRARYVSPASVAALAGISHPTAGRLLGRLRAVHLLEPKSRRRYRLERQVWGYAAERAAAEIPAVQRGAGIGRLCAWYVHSAWAAARTLSPAKRVLPDLGDAPPGVSPMRFDSPSVAMRWCNAELENLAAIVQMAADHETGVSAWHLAAALFDYFRLTRQWVVWEETHEIALRAARAAHDLRGQSWIFANMAEANRLREDFAQSQLRYAVALASARQAGDQHGQARAYLGAAWVAADCGHGNQAEALAARAERMFAGLGDREGQAQALGTMGEVHLSRGQLRQAGAVLHEALGLFETLGCRRGCGWMLSKVAAVDLALGAQEASLAALNDALTAFNWSEDRWNAADTLVRRGEVLGQLGRFAQARRSWRLALAFYKQLGDRRAANVRDRLAGLPDSAGDEGFMVGEPCPWP